MTLVVGRTARAAVPGEPLRQGQELLGQRDYPAALASFEESIRAIDAAGGPVAPELVEPLFAAAKANVALQRPEAAIRAARRAVNIVRRSGGLYDQRQQPGLELLVEQLALTGHPDEARTELRFLESAGVQAHGEQSIGQVRLLADVGEWLCRLGDFQAGRTRFRNARKLIERVTVDDATRLRSLTGMAHCFLFELASFGIETPPTRAKPFLGVIVRAERMTPGIGVFRRHVAEFMRADGDNGLAVAADLAEQSTTLSAEQRIDALLGAGDWFLIKDHLQAARRYYSRAYALSERLAAGPDLAMANPLQILYANPAAFAVPVGTPRPQRYVVADFTIRPDGRVESLRVIESDARGWMLGQTKSALLDARYRPAYAAGMPGRTTGVRFRQSFSAK